MSTIKEKLIKEIEAINDEGRLFEIYTALQNFMLSKSNHVFILNDEQKVIIEQAREDYRNGNYYDAEEAFAELLNE